MTGLHSQGEPILDSIRKATSGLSVIDSHQHFWDLKRLKYEWMPPCPHILHRTYLPDDLLPSLQRNGVTRTVLVQAHHSMDETDFLLDLASRNDFVAGVVVWIDLTSPDIDAILDKLCRNPRVVGIRHQAELEPDEAWLCRNAVIHGLKAVAEHGITYDLLVKPQHLKYIPRLAEQVPDLRMVIDHIAKPLIAEGKMEPWASLIAEVSAIPGLYCKVSGMVTEADHSRWKTADFKPYISHVIEKFGLARLMWGSDWPVCLMAASYEQVLKLCMDAVGTISCGDRARFLGKNAIEFYHLDKVDFVD